MKVKDTEKPMFSEKELEELNFTEEELETLRLAEATVDMFDKLPDDITKLVDRVHKEFPDDPTEIYNKLATLGDTDKDLLTQLLIMNEIFSGVKEYKPSVEKVSATAITTSNVEDALAKSKEILAQFKNNQE